MPFDLDPPPPHVRGRPLPVGDLGVAVEVGSLKTIDQVDLPPLRAARPQVERLPAAPVEEDDGGAEQLGSLTQLAIEKAREILELPLDPGDEEFGTILRAQANQVQVVLNTQVRVDDARLRRRGQDKLSELLKIIAHEEMNLTLRVG